MKMNEGNKKKLNRKAIVAAAAAVIVLAAIVLAMNYMENRPTGAAEGEESRELVNIGGFDCYKKQNVETYLLLGVDSVEGADTTETDSDSSIQCDTVILLVIDRADNTYATLHLDRDAMAVIDIPDEDGNKLGENNMQLALAYAYGDGKEESCELAETAVSRMLHDQRIDGYAALRMDSIGVINNLVGGVDVTVPDSFADGSGLVKGQRVHLTDKQAEAFVRGRKSVGDGSNENRMRRQQAYLDALYPQLINKIETSSSFVNDAVSRLDKYMVTDMTNSDFSRIAKAVSSNEKLKDIDIKYTRTINKSTGYAEVVYDQDSLDEAVIRLFYDPVEEWYFEDTE